MIGYDPVMLEFINIKEWLEEDNNDNFVILGEFTFKKKKVSAILLKKSYFLNIPDNDLFYVCHSSNNGDFLPKQTYELNHLNHNIGKFLKHDKSKSESNYSMVKRDILIKALQKKNQIYEIKYPNYAFDNTYINKEALEMSQIGVLNFKEQSSKDVFKTLQTKQGINSFEDIYFEAKLSDALYGYSHRWDKGINNYLRFGDNFFDSDYFFKEWTKYTIGNGKKQKTKEKAKENIRQKVKDIDECFLHSGERNENTKQVYYRGMRGGYGHNAVGDKILVKNFTSISTSLNEAISFKSGAYCCVFNITLEKGIPMINMENTTKYKVEKEYLLPRNLIFKCLAIHKDKNDLITRYDIKVSKQEKEQFKVNSNCIKYPQCEIKVSKKKVTDFVTDVLDEEMKSENVIMQLSEINKSDSVLVPDTIDIVIKRLNEKYATLELLGEKDILSVKKAIKNKAKKELKISIFGDMEIKNPKKYLAFYKLYDKLLDEKIREFKSKMKICPPGSILNKKTNRCNKIKTPKKPAPKKPAKKPAPKKPVKEPTPKKPAPKKPAKEISVIISTIQKRIDDKIDKLDEFGDNLELGVNALKWDWHRIIKNDTKKEMGVSSNPGEFNKLKEEEPENYKKWLLKYENNIDNFIGEFLKKSKVGNKLSSKVCPEGSILNIKTNRCNKIKTPKKPKAHKVKTPKVKSPKVKTPKVPKAPKAPKVKSTKVKKLCPPGSILNEKTNRCNKIKTPKKPKKTSSASSTSSASGEVKDVLDNLITINGHGSFNHQKIKVPQGYHILIPHRNGLEAHYTTPDAGKNKLYEEDLYKKGFLNYRDGWKLYLPGDDINNLKIHPFHDGASCSTIKSSHELQRELIEKCEGQNSYDKFCPLYCTENTGNKFIHLRYKDKRKIKIKACDNYELKDLFDTLRGSLNKIPKAHLDKISPKKDEPIILIPFTCNAKASSQLNYFDHSNHKKLNTIYQELIKNR